MIAPPPLETFQPAVLRSARATAVEQAILLIDAPPGFDASYRRPGQFAWIQVDGEVGIFAMATRPSETPVRFLVRTEGTDGGDAADRLAALPDGSEIQMTLAAGAGFATERAEGSHLFLVATGTGIAPVMSVLEEVLCAPERYESITLIHGVKTPSHLTVGDAIDRWRRSGVETHLCYSRAEGPDGSSRHRRVQGAFDEMLHAPSATSVVAVGQPEMVESLRATFVERGGPPERFLTNL